MAELEMSAREREIFLMGERTGAGRACQEMAAVLADLVERASKRNAAKLIVEELDRLAELSAEGRPRFSRSLRKLAGQVPEVSTFLTSGVLAQVDMLNQQAQMQHAEMSRHLEAARRSEPLARRLVRVLQAARAAWG